ncbi:damage-control phosphatase ARMT1-like isoform X2 [Plodia interpunctella]|uniref:damage-control phosphatase ARMT1-like isoform X2 n=1 Tax=Plodia interpunctella TaxID=58824 RepID=UPI0023682462|nr:damage-control phosphatase ARMT1-like isoform X2 [Plodia interpunctella]
MSQSKISPKGSQQQIQKGKGSKNSIASPRQSAVSSISIISVFDDIDGTTPDFIYGGPFITVEKPSPFLSTATPINMQLQGTFKKSFAYFCLKEKLPVILTKIIDNCSRNGASIRSSTGASDGDLQKFIQHVSKLKSDLITNKPYDPFTIDTEEAKKWNEWIQSQTNSKYFTNIWLFTECYVYRKIREGCEISPALMGFDPFEAQKQKSFQDTLEMMAIVGEKLPDMLPPSEKDKRKQDFMTLLKVCLWANRCDLSLTAGNALNISKGDDGNAVLDPFQMVVDYKDKLLVDDSGKAADQIVAKSEAIAKAIEGIELSNSGSPPKSPTPEAPEEEAEGPKVPCPAKMTVPQSVIFDIVCDNAGFELFADLCFAHFIVSQNITQKVRFHVKSIPWYVSDVTPKDFNFVIQASKGASYNRTVTPEPKPAPADGGDPPEPEPPRLITSAGMQSLAAQWQQLLEDGTFIVMADEFWTYPHPYKDMKKYSPNLFRKLQYACGILFKGDLNYRKLLGEMNWPSTQGFDPSLQGFNPAPIIAVRTVKSEVICGLPKGKADQLSKLDPEWMEKGDYGVIQFSGKAEALKISDRPCEDYGEVCFGTVCPVHTDI